jgi:oxygen-independent coproporphyrinogen-3 oxidase
MEKVGINNISLDIITGLPNETIDSFKSTLEFATTISTNIKHISTYSLEVHENTKLATLIEAGFVSLPTEDEERQMNDLTYDILEKNGYNMYEISNYAKNGYESKHNLNYWNQGSYLGFGAAAASFINGKRYTNISDIDKYIDKVNNLENIAQETEELDKLDTIKEYIILKLRLAEGIDINEFYSKFKINIFDMYKTEIEDLIDKKLLEYNNNRIYLTPYGRDLANIVWQKFI